MSDSERDQLIDQFVTVTRASRSLAEQYLDRNDNDVMTSIEDFYANSQADESEGAYSSASGGGGSSQPAAPSRKPKSGGIRTMRDLNNQDNDEDDNTDTNFFTGGEKSGLQVEDPNKDKKKKAGRGGVNDGGDGERSLIDSIFQRAKEQAEQPDDRPSAQQPPAQARSQNFNGTGFKLGGEDTPSEEVIDPTSRIPERPAKVSREITFWKQGFSVGEGPLHRYDDPANAGVLQELNQGRVPVALLDVEFGQDVDVSVFKKTEEDWVPPKKKVGGFHGQGQRLGSPVPGEFSAPSPKPTEEVAPTTQSEDKPVIDVGEGDSLVQIRFASGKKTSHRFNSTDSIVTVYEFVRNHPDAGSSERPFILSHSFPVKPIEESQEVTVADAKLKNAVIVQRWK